MDSTCDPIVSSLRCHQCGYDLRAQPPTGNCPECGASVEEARQQSLIPRRPAWRDSDPRWRRRMLAGVWVITILPLVDLLNRLGWDRQIIIPTPFDLRGPLTLDETFAARMSSFWEYLTLCIGAVLLFSTERHRRRSRLDWTRPCGVGSTYAVFFLGIPHFMFITSLVIVGIAALFLSMPLRYQPSSTSFFVYLGWNYLHFGPHPSIWSGVALGLCSSMTITLACVPLYEALRSVGSKWLAGVWLAPLLIGVLCQPFHSVRYPAGTLPVQFMFNPFYFGLDFLIRAFWTNSWQYYVEFCKWAVFAVIALRLSIEQVLWWRHPIAMSAPADRNPKSIPNA